MSINFANVKAITIPEGSVKAISSGGVILWQLSEDPYEILSFIDIPYGCYINLKENGSSAIGTKIDANFNVEGTATASGTHQAFGAIYNDGSTYYRYHTQVSNAGAYVFYYGSGNNYLSSDVSLSNSRHVYEINYHTYGDNALYVDGVSKGTYPTPSAQSCGNLYIGGRRFDNNGTVTINDFYYTIRLFALEMKKSASSTIYFYPAKRKSDGKVGLYKVDGDTTEFLTSDTAVDPTPSGEAVIPESQWAQGFDNYYHWTGSTKFWDLLSNDTTDGKVANVTLTISVYNPTEDATYTTSTTNNLTYNAADSKWNNAAFNVKAVYNSNGDYLNIWTFTIRNGGSSEWNGTIIAGTPLTNLYNTYGCNLTGDIKLVINSVN